MWIVFAGCISSIIHDHIFAWEIFVDDGSCEREDVTKQEEETDLAEIIGEENSEMFVGADHCCLATLFLACLYLSDHPSEPRSQIPVGIIMLPDLLEMHIRRSGFHLWGIIPRPAQYKKCLAILPWVTGTFVS